MRGYPKNTALYRTATGLVHRGRTVGERLGRIFLVALIVRTIQEMSADDATHMAAGVAYYALFSLFPLLLGLIAILSFFLESQDIQTRLTSFATDYLPGSGRLVEENIKGVLAFRGALGLFAVVGLFWSGSAIFGAVNRSINRAWDVHKDRPIYIGKPRQLVMALAVGLLFMMSVSTATLARIAGRLGQIDFPGVDFLVSNFVRVLLQGSSFLLMLMIFLLIYKFMPNTKTYWRYIWPGAVVGAFLFEICKNLFIVYLNQFAKFENIYGSLAPVIALLLWAYVSSLILILGAELSSEYGRLRNRVARGVPLHAALGSRESSSG